MPWESIGDSVYRYRLHGLGWLVLIREDVWHNEAFNGYHVGMDFRKSITFVPDPNGEWRI